MYHGMAKPLEAGGASRALAALLVPFECDADVVLHAARALAKLSLHAELWCNANR